MPPSFLELPIPTLTTLVSGYIGYYIANVGIRDHHKQIDITFLTLVYGLIGLLAYHIIRAPIQYFLGTPIGIFCGICSAIAASGYAGAYWRKIGRDLFREYLRKKEVSYADDIPSAWISLFDAKNVEYNQITVFLNNGEKLMCNDLGAYTKEKKKSHYLGTNGDILMYVTHKIHNGEILELDDLKNDEWGIELTYIPAHEIRRVIFRRTEK